MAVISTCFYVLEITATRAAQQQETSTMQHTMPDQETNDLKDIKLISYLMRQLFCIVDIFLLGLIAQP